MKRAFSYYIYLFIRYARCRQSLFQQFLNLLFDVSDLLSGFEAGDNLALLVDEELGEVPLDVSLLLVVRVCLRQHFVQQRRSEERRVGKECRL